MEIDAIFDQDKGKDKIRIDNPPTPQQHPIFTS